MCTGRERFDAAFADVQVCQERFKSSILEFVNVAREIDDVELEREFFGVVRRWVLRQYSLAEEHLQPRPRALH